MNNNFAAGAVAGAAMFLVTGCSGEILNAPNPLSLTAHVSPRSYLSSVAAFKTRFNTIRPYKSFDACPSSGSIEYLADANNNVINIYKGSFAGQGPCGQLSPSGLIGPRGMFVRGSTHDLYVTNAGGRDVLAFHRGAISPFATYTDPNVEYPYDVTVATDGTVIASNGQDYVRYGSISTWHSDGTFVGNFPMDNSLFGLYVNVQDNGTLYFNAWNLILNAGVLWSGTCPAGACGAFTPTGAQTSFPGGLRWTDKEDVVQIDQGNGPAVIPGMLTTYETFPAGASCVVAGAGDPASIDIDKYQHHIFYADLFKNGGGELAYPSCVPVGTVSGNPNGKTFGVAVDPPESN